MPTFCGLSEAFPEATAAAAIVTVADESGMLFGALPVFLFTAAHKKHKASDRRTGDPNVVTA
jgi:hypothetical protein